MESEEQAYGDCRSIGRVLGVEISRDTEAITPAKPCPWTIGTSTVLSLDQLLVRWEWLGP
jgi:hypothetical protein